MGYGIPNPPPLMGPRLHFQQQLWNRQALQEEETCMCRLFKLQVKLFSRFDWFLPIIYWETDA